MSQNGPSPEVACTLTEKQEQKRSEKVRSRLISHYVGYEETEDGLAVRFDGTDESLPAVAQFTASELQCCAFAEYEITVTPPYEETVLTMTGPDGTRQMFRDGLVDRLEAETA
ncbi:hypothetical protein [Natrinema gelatinilyticum]|uniref:hypothetical protein n=1 Tax=Natrinema gelatinilyticum TaxID=2961571 RepID=UPI0020C2922C|nr:hypothetical protein [Natrinema gelatinilyticum]